MFFTPLLQGGALSIASPQSVSSGFYTNSNDIFTISIAGLWQDSVIKYLSSSRTKVFLPGIKNKTFITSKRG